MAITRLNNNSITSITALPSAITTGKVLQVVNGSTNYSENSTSTSFIDVNSASSTAWETSITPSSTASKILVMGSLSFTGFNGSGDEGRASVKAFYKIGSGSYNQYKEYYENTGGYDYGSVNGGIWVKQSLPISTLLSLSTTSAVTFKFQMAVNSGATIQWNSGTSTSQITLMEISA